MHDLDLLRDHLTRLVAGEEIMVPRFDFETRTSHRNDRPVQLHKDEIVMIEGIHAFNPVIMGDLEKHGDKRLSFSGERAADRP